MAKIIDADSHVIEPMALWEENLEPEYRNRTMRITKDAHGLGADRFIWGADYPHSDDLVGAVKVLKENLRPLAKED